MHIQDKLLSPDEPNAGELDATTAAAMEAATNAASDEKAGDGDGSGGSEGTTSGSDAETDPALGGEPEGLSAELDAIMLKHEGETTDNPKAEPKAKAEPKPEKFEPISDEEIQAAAVQAGLTNTANPAIDGVPGSIAAKIEPKAPAAPAAAAEPAKAPEPSAADKAIEALEAKAKDVPEIAEVVEVTKALHEQNKALQARLDAQDAAKKAAAEAQTKAKTDAEAREAKYKAEVEPILLDINAIPNLNKERYGVYDPDKRDGVTMTGQQYRERIKLDVATNKLAQTWLSQGKKFSKAQLWDAGHRSLEPKTPKTPPTTREAVVADLRKQHNSRTAAGLSRGSSGKSPAIFSSKDTPAQAMEKAFQAATAASN